MKKYEFQNHNGLCNANNAVCDLLDFIEEEKQRRAKTNGFFKNGELQDKQIGQLLGTEVLSL